MFEIYSNFLKVYFYILREVLYHLNINFNT